MNSITGSAPLSLSLWFFTAIKNNIELNSLMRTQETTFQLMITENFFFLDRVALFRKEFTWEENKCISLDLHSGTAQNGTINGFFPLPKCHSPQEKQMTGKGIHEKTERGV